MRTWKISFGVPSRHRAMSSPLFVLYPTVSPRIFVNPVTGFARQIFLNLTWFSSRRCFRKIEYVSFTCTNSGGSTVFFSTQRLINRSATKTSMLLFINEDKFRVQLGDVSP